MTFLKDHVSDAAREFSARISKAKDVEVRLRLRREYEALCSSTSSYHSDHYDHRAENQALNRMENELRRLGL